VKRFLLTVTWLSFAIVGLAAPSRATADDDLLIADFEGDSYGDWKVEGAAFGARPAVANVEPPNKVTGHQGSGLVNSFLGGDAPLGKLTSPEFTIERGHINFLIGAGNHEGKTCLNLLVDGKIVRSAIGPALKNDQDQEVMDWTSWDVQELKGKQVTLQIVDDHSGGWGHINIDQIVQTDTPRKPSYPNFARLTDPELRNVSRVPKFTFPETLEEQEAALKSNPLLKRFAESRKELLKDPHYPRYHFSSPEHRLNDPNGLCYWKGKWHLFYQGYPPEDPRQHWGHAVSDDLIHWRDLPYAIYPNPERACYSGSALVEEDRVIAMYHGTTVGSMVAVSDDPLLLNWKKVTGQAVIPHAPNLPYNIFDPCIWKHGDYYYALTAGRKPHPEHGKSVRAEFLHRSKDLAKWQYLHTFLENDRWARVGDDGACPYFWPIGTGKHRKHILLHFSHKRGGMYMLGDYDTDRDKFVVTHGGDFNHGPVGPGGVHAPSACPDPANAAEVISIFNMNPAKGTKGWNQLMTLPMRLALLPPDDPDKLHIAPAGDIESLRHEHQHLKQTPLPADKQIVLENIKGNTMEIKAVIDPRGAREVVMDVLRSPGAEEYTRITLKKSDGKSSPAAGFSSTTITLDNTRSSKLPDARSRPPETARFALPDNEPVELRIFIDRSVVEVFANGRQYVALRVYPGREDSLGVALHAVGNDATLKSLDAWQMKGIYK
jgi:beta-fructofuranosidase